MKTVDMKALRERLPFGSLGLIGERLGISAKVVSAVFVYGWYSEHRENVIKAAMDILKEKQEKDSAIMQEAEGLGLVTTSLFPIPRKRAVVKELNTEGGLPGFADLFEMNREELEDYALENDLEVDPDDFDSFWRGAEKNRIALVYAICEELEMDVPEWDDIHEETRGNLEEIIEDLELEIDPKDFDEDKDLADEICQELDIEEPEDENDDDE